MNLTSIVQLLPEVSCGGQVLVCENNNCATSAAITALLGDLSETAVSLLTSSVVAGGTISVNDNTYNSGPGAVGASVTAFYLSSDGTSRTKILGTRNLGALAPGAFAGIATTTLAIPTNISGAYYLLACADAQTNVKESDETNNCLRTARFNIASVDLTTSGLQMLTAAPGAGVPALVSETTTNLGPGVSSQSVTGFYLSRDGVTKSYSVGTRVVPSLAAGTSSGPSTTTINVPLNISGTFYLIACADSRGSITEVNENNNCVTSTPFLITGPDLAVTAAAISSDVASRGTVLQVTETTSNLSPAAIASTVTGYYLSRDGAVKIYSLGSRLVPALLPNGASGPATTAVTIPLNISVGTYNVLACADSFGTVAESNESNNCAATTQFVVR